MGESMCSVYGYRLPGQPKNKQVPARLHQAPSYKNQLCQCRGARFARICKIYNHYSKELAATPDL